MILFEKSSWQTGGMPRVTTEYRDAKRDEIARAAVVCIKRQGFAGATMADIIAESGASAGSIYSHFSGKADIARYIAAEVVGRRILALSRLVADRGELLPSEAIEFALTELASDDPPLTVILQLWAEATVHPELADLIRETFDTLRSGFVEAILPWARARSDDEADAAALAARTAFSMTAVGQGYIASSALRGPIDPQEFVRGIRHLDGE